MPGLADLVPALLEPYATPDCEIEIDVMPNAGLDQAQVDTLALVLGELAVNSTKHGALSAKGTIRVSGTLADDRIELNVVGTIGSHGCQPDAGRRTRPSVDGARPCVAFGRHFA